jgi:hypothetical protein
LIEKLALKNNSGLFLMCEEQLSTPFWGAGRPQQYMPSHHNILYYQNNQISLPLQWQACDFPMKLPVSVSSCCLLPAGIFYLFRSNNEARGITKSPSWNITLQINRNLLFYDDSG